MPIRAQLPDGQILEFPDGTADSVIDSTVQGFLKSAASPAAPAAAPEGTPFADSLSGEFAGFAPALGTPPARSLTEQVAEQRQAPGAPADPLLDPKFVQAVEGRLNALPAEQREAALNKLLQRGDVYGRAARVVQGKYAQLNKIETELGREMADPRLEAQTARYIRQGAPRDLAEHLAKRDALSGRIGRGIQRLERDVVGEKAGAEAEARARELAGAGFLERVGAEAKSLTTTGSLGLINAFADITGDKEMQGIAADARRVEKERQGAIPKGATIFERSAQSAIASLATQTPMIALSMVTGTAAPVLIQAGLQQFGDSYGEARASGVTPERAAARAIPMAAAEIFFERFGMERAMAGLKAFVDKNGYAEVPKYVAKAIATELPSEMATTVTQYGIDILPEVGLNKNPSLLGLYQQLEETLRQTVIQAGAQSGIVIAGAKGAEKFGQALEKARTKKYARDESYEGLAELLARSKGFLTPELRQAPPVTPPAEEAPPAVEEAPAPTSAAAAPAAATDVRIEELTARGVEAGLPEEDARVRAQNIVAAEQARQEQAFAPRIEALTQEFVDAGVEPTQARARAVEQVRQEVEADASAERELGGAAAPEPAAGGAGVAVAGRPEPGAPTEGTAGLEPTGVAPAGPATEVPAGGEAGVPAALKQQKAAVSFKGNQGIVANESVLGGLRRISEDDDIALEFPDRAGAVMLTGLDRQAGGRAGRASEVVKALTDWADKNNETLVLSPAASGDLKQPDLISWYERNGFRQMPDGAMQRNPVSTGKKRGRPAVLTPEEKAAKAAEKKPLQAAKMKAERAVTRLTKTLDELAKPIDLEKIESDEALAQAEADRTANRREAVKELLQLQAAPNLRGTKVGERVKAALTHPSITPKELADIKAGLELQQRALASAEAVSRTGVETATRPVEPAFTKFTNASQAINHIIKNGTPFEKMLAKRLRGFVNGVKLVVVEEGQPLPNRLTMPRNKAAWERARALYAENDISGDRAIFLRGASFGDDHGMTTTIVLHELLHAATNRKIALAIKAIQEGKDLNSPLVRAAQDLLRTMNNAVRRYNEMADAGQLSKTLAAIARSGEALTDPREFISYGMTDPDFQKFLMTARGVEEDTSFFTRFVDGIRRLFGMSDDTVNALSDLIVVTDKVLSARAPRGRVGEAVSRATKADTEPAERTQKEIERDFDVANEKFNQSLNGEEYAKNLSAIQMVQDPKKVGRWMRAMWGTFSLKARNAMTYVAPTDFLANTFGEDVPELLNTDKLIQKMGGLTLNLLKSAGKLTDEVNRAYRKDKTLQGKLDRITNVSTLMEVDPSDPTAKERSAKLDKLWADLGADGQRLYTRIKEHFEVLSDYFTQLLDEQITQSELPIAERANLMQKIRAMYETGTKITPFFPLVRRGDYWLSIGSGKTRKFFMFETMAERDEAMQGFADERVKRKEGESAAAFEQRRARNLQDLLESQEYTFGNDIGTLRRMSEDTSELLKGVFAAIENTSLSDPESKEALKDAVYQIYLQTMPEQSFRRQFIHRKGVTGFRTDILRNTADASTRMASQLARLKYGRLLRNSLSQARDSIVNRPEYEPIVNAFERRVNAELNPKPETGAEKVVGAINKASFIWYLGAASSALLQPLSIFQTGLPVLAAQHGFAKTSAELSKMMKVWDQYGVYEKNADGSTSFKMPTVEHAEGLSDEERRAVRSMLDYGLTTSTYADNVFDYKNTPSGNYSRPIVQFGKDTVDNLVLGGLMHTTERISREVVFLTSFRLNRKAGKSYDESIDQAVLDTKEALGNYGEYNRPEVMRGATGKFLTLFMMYPVHVTLFLARNFIEMIRPMGGRTRSEAVSKFFGTLGTTSILAGAIGLPMFSAVMGLLGWAWSKLVPDDDEELRKLSFELWFRTKWLQDQLGETKIAGKSLADIVERGLANAITGLDISGRTSLNNLWMRDTKEYATVRENAAAMALEKAGPSANMVLSWAEAYEAAMLGDYAKAAKKATPAGFRNFIAAYEQYKEGAKDNKGAKILSRDAFTTGELIGQAVGFRSDLLANTQYVTFKVIGLEQQINNDRQRILNSLDREYRDKNVKAYTKYYKEMLEFNRKHPTYAITDDNLMESLERKAEQRATSYRGVILTEKNIGVLAPALIPSRKAAAEKEKKGRGE